MCVILKQKPSKFVGQNWENGVIAQLALVPWRIGLKTDRMASTRPNLPGWQERYASWNTGRASRRLHVGASYLPRLRRPRNHLDVIHRRPNVARMPRRRAATPIPCSQLPGLWTIYWQFIPFMPFIPFMTPIMTILYPSLEKMVPVSSLVSETPKFCLNIILKHQNWMSRLLHMLKIAWGTQSHALITLYCRKKKLVSSAAYWDTQRGWISRSLWISKTAVHPQTKQ